MKDAIKIQDLTVHYNEIPALWDINVEIPEGLLVGILGPNGGGKSTFIKSILGLVKPISGSILINGKPCEKIKKKIAYVPQRESVDWNFPITCEELVLMGRFPKLGLFKWIRKADRLAAQKCLHSVGLHNVSHRTISELSGGQQQRAFLARALLQDADFYFFDEPLAGVDHVSEKIIMDLLSDMKKKNKTILMVHHDLNSVESYFDWIVLLNVRLVKAGPTSQVFTKKYMQEAYQKSFILYDETMKISQNKTAGIN